MLFMQRNSIHAALGAAASLREAGFISAAICISDTVGWSRDDD
jgi:hypothetical protein